MTEMDRKVEKRKEDPLENDCLNEGIEIDDESETSSESAGIARGIARTLADLQRRVAIGRVPMPRSGKIHHRFPVRRVADISDKVSNMLDISSEVMDAYSNGDDAKIEKKKNADKKSSIINTYGPRFQRFLAFGGNIVKNSILGTVVFESYCKTIETTASVFNSNKITSSTTSLPRNNHQYHDQYSSVSLSMHFVAGSLAGTAHGTLNELIQSFLDRSLPTYRSIAFNVLHHSVSHSILFGSYEMIKRSLFALFRHENSFASSENGNFNSEMDVSRFVSTSNVSIVAFSGGVAGIGQHIFSHYVEFLESDFIKRQTQPRHLFHRLRFATHPSPRSMFAVFPGMAITFIGFEYGKETFS